MSAFDEIRAKVEAAQSSMRDELNRTLVRGAVLRNSNGSIRFMTPFGFYDITPDDPRHDEAKKLFPYPERL